MSFTLTTLNSGHSIVPNDSKKIHLKQLEYSAQFTCSVVYNSLPPHELKHTRLPCPSLSPGVCSNSCPSSQWCHLTISSSVVPFSTSLQSFPASRSFPVNQFFISSGQSIGGSASVLPMKIQGWFPCDLLAVQGTHKSLLLHHCGATKPTHNN